MSDFLCYTKNKQVDVNYCINECKYMFKNDCSTVIAYQQGRADGYNKAHEELETKYQELLYQAETIIKNKAIDDFVSKIEIVSDTDWRMDLGDIEEYETFIDELHIVAEQLKGESYD